MLTPTLQLWRPCRRRSIGDHRRQYRPHSSCHRRLDGNALGCCTAVSMHRWKDCLKAATDIGNWTLRDDAVQASDVESYPAQRQ